MGYKLLINYDFILMILSKFINLPFTKIIQPIFFILIISDEILIEYKSWFFLFKIFSYCFSKFAEIGFKNIRLKHPNKKIEIATGKKISNIEYPIFLIEVNSLLFIKYLNRNDIDIIVTKGNISFIIEGIFNKVKNK